MKLGFIKTKIKKLLVITARCYNAYAISFSKSDIGNEVNL